MPMGKSAVALGECLLNILAQGEDVTALAHGNGEADGWLSVNAKQRLRRVGKATPDLRNVAQA